MSITTFISVFCAKNCAFGPVLPKGKAEGRDTWEKKGLFSEVTFQVRTEASYTVANELLDLWITNERTRMSKAAWWVSTSGQFEFPINAKIKAVFERKCIYLYVPKWIGEAKEPPDSNIEISWFITCSPSQSMYNNIYSERSTKLDST